MQFFVLEVEVGSPHETRFHQVEPVHRGDCLYCPTCGVPVTSLTWLPPYRAELKAYGKELGDVAFFGDELLVSSRFRQAWEAANLRGLVFEPLERLRIRPARLGKKTATYFFVAPRLFGTQVDVERSRIGYNRPITCDKCKSGGFDDVRGFAIDEASWTGEDMFYCWGVPGSIIVTDRVRQLRDDHGLKNVPLTPVEEYFWDPLYKWTPIDYSRDEDTKSDENSDDKESAAN
jgi:hypothetical protein